MTSNSGWPECLRFTASWLAKKEYESSAKSKRRWTGFSLGTGSRRTQLARGTVLICESSTLGGLSFSSAIQFEVDSGLQPLKLQWLKPLIRRSFSSGLKSRPPVEWRDVNYFQIRTVPSRLNIWSPPEGGV